MTDQQFITDLRARATAPSERTVTAVDLCREAGITYRQMDYWCSTGRLRPIGRARPGTGCDRRLPLSEVEIATLIRRLLDAGMTLQAAHDAARSTVAGTVARVGDGLVLLVRPGER